MAATTTVREQDGFDADTFGVGKRRALRVIGAARAYIRSYGNAVQLTKTRLFLPLAA
jgi:hypothetical protein